MPGISSGWCALSVCTQRHEIPHRQGADGCGQQSEDLHRQITVVAVYQVVDFLLCQLGQFLGALERSELSGADHPQRVPAWHVNWQLRTRSAGHQHMDMGTGQGWQQARDARRPRWTNVFIKPVDSQQQMPSVLDCPVGRPLPQCPVLVHARLRCVYVAQESQLRHDRR